MANTLEKTRKQISKKKGGNMNSLHQNSRDSKRLHKAKIRDDRLEKMASEKKKKDKPLLGRVAFFHGFVEQHESKAFSIEEVQAKVHEFVHQYDEEYAEERANRRVGRSASMKEELLKARVTALEREHRDGFLMPDLTSEASVEMLQRWEGSWAYLPNLTWVKISPTGEITPARFPATE